MTDSPDPTLPLAGLTCVCMAANVPGPAAAALLAAQGRLPVKHNRAVGVIYQGHAVGTPGEIEVEIEVQDGQVTAVHVGGCAALDREGYWQGE